ncbi:DUF3429 domain-containing protein [Leptothrix sp. BB-4]
MSSSPSLTSLPTSSGHGPNPVALRLGYAGLAPFVLGALLTMLIPADLYEGAVLDFVFHGLMAYAAAIVSFLGGIHWGLGMRSTVPSPVPFAWGVAPSLLAWFAMLLPAHAGLVIAGLSLVACYLVDRRTYPAHGLGHWMTLRFRLTLVASLSCFLAAASY